MEFTRPSQSNLSLGFAPHTNQPTNDTVSFQINSSFRGSSPHVVSSVPLQLMEPQTITEGKHMDLNEKHQQVNDGSMGLNAESKVGEEEDEEFRILGHSMCLKRLRDSSSSCATTDSASSHTVSKRCYTDQNSQGPSLESRIQAVRAWGNQSLQEADPDIFEILEKEKERQYKGIELIASENFFCKAVLEALGSHVANKYSEGMPGARYYAGNQYIDEIETLCRKRALDAFGLDSESWG